MSSAPGIHLSGLLSHADLYSISTSFVLLYVTSIAITTIYDAFFGPLSRFPGPKSRALSIWPHIRSISKGEDNHVLPALHRQYGEVVRIGPKNLSFLGTAETWKGIYGFKIHGRPENMKDLTFYGRTVNREPSLLISDGPSHARQRKIVSHAFSDRSLKEQEPMLKMWAGKLRDLLERTVNQGVAIDLVRAYNYTTFDIMGDLTFAEPLHMLDNSEYTPWVKTIFASIKAGTMMRMLKTINGFSRWLVEELIFRFPALRKKQMEHWKYTTDRVDRRLAATPERPDLWTRILEKGGDPRGSNAGLTLGEHQSNASLFMIAGTETTATALSGITYRLLRNPKDMQQLQQELRSAFNSIDDMHLEPLARLPMLEACIKEGIRLYPPVPTGLPRVAPAGGCLVGEHFVPEGTSISVHHYSTYTSEQNFKHPLEFRPERWLGDPEFKDDHLDAWEPFHVGPRNCLGKNLAWHEMRLLLATTLVHFDLGLCPESEDWTDQKVYSLWEKRALMCRLTPVKT